MTTSARVALGAAVSAILLHCGGNTIVYEPAPVDDSGASGSGSGSSGSGSGSGSGSASGSSGGSTSGSGSGGSSSSGSGGSSSTSSSGSGSGSGSSSTSGSSSGGGFFGPQNPGCTPLGTPADPGMAPQTTFEPQPSYIPNDMIILTLDDGPDGTGCTGVMGDSTSCTVLDNEFFVQQGMKVDFFLNTNNRCTVAPMFGCYGYAQQLIQAGHYIANHTVHHYHLAPGGGTGDGIMHCMDASCVQSEISGVESTVSMLTNGKTTNLTRFRAPFGEPYQNGSASDRMLVEPVVAQYAVSVNWNFDSGDSNGMTWDGVSLLNNITSIIQTPGKGAWGIMLAHAVYPWTTTMLPQLIPYLKQNGFHLATVEDVICWRFGKHSWEIIPNKTPN